MSRQLRSVRRLVSYICCSWSLFCLAIFFFNDPATTEIYTLSLHDALPICAVPAGRTRCPALRYLPADDHPRGPRAPGRTALTAARSEEHTSELQSPVHLVCRLLLEKKNKKIPRTNTVTPNILLNCHVTSATQRASFGFVHLLLLVTVLSCDFFF